MFMVNNVTVKWEKRNITNKYRWWNFFHSSDVDVIVTQQDCVSILLICIAKVCIYSQNSSTKSMSSIRDRKSASRTLFSFSVVKVKVNFSTTPALMFDVFWVCFAWCLAEKNFERLSRLPSSPLTWAPACGALCLSETEGGRQIQQQQK